MTRELDASQFQEECLSLLDRRDPEGIVMTKRGKPVARLIPIESGCAELIGSLKGRVWVKDDIFSAGIKWDAES
jgi:antitoxin (DNA-binding transcriptional repressor) of toxin-antitoxin stability system